MVFKLAVFVAILIAIAVLGAGGYRAAVQRYEAGLAGREGDPHDDASTH